MGVLDRLAEEARESRQRREAADSARTRQETAARARLTPALDRVARYLERLVTHLREMDRAVEVEYRLDDIGTLAGLRQQSYRVTRDDEQDGGAVRLLFECAGPSPLEVKVHGHEQAESRGRKLRGAGLSCKSSPVSRRVMRLRVEPKVPVRVSFSPDLHRERVWLELRNLNGIGVQRYALAPERIDEELLDAVASLVLREPSAFAELTGSVVADTRREDLKRRLARDRRRRDAELAGGLRRLLFPVTEWFRGRFPGG